MAVETLNKDSKVVVYNSEVELADKGVRKNHQGVAAEALNFIKTQADAPTTGKRGELIYSSTEGKIYLATADDTFKTFTQDA